ncbi:hypothetical protein A2774_02015 [Candidatus Roizmanbacteria bacterium RIFCSPHIGHO2_01_FULL_39_12c]|uniref:Zinc-ribbon domain-containing protein n=1 Tax=Candidatus Roizmanbacteria bacterium RIFCSPHIGHO2_01_FULL_39_12c TaxID=1802031 RepID=A0A1F7GFV2_9BACT|nr:MAG: hypothetical protein A2774_02015 [Candidatus Roizmanbacteria bacterium RIFCSPHIGHO2_01_FULL_39_12c]OGK47223.1 MAG: hypothetical protein A2963_04115 [Candidatus Roizmanbacteria bacterium RIFCSPLOWO2_01_FULL_40_13]
MYCNNCGKHNPEDSKFCKHCGAEIVRVSAEHKADSLAQSEVKSSTTETTEKGKAGLTGWLALVGLGLIIGLFIQGYGALEYLPLLSDTYNIPGYLTLLQLEFIGSIFFTVATAYLLYLYLKKNERFPRYYFIFLIASIVYVILDHLLLASLSAPTQELQKVISDALSENTSVVGRTIIVSTIWALYIKKSKQVKVAFTKN